ncbi:ATP-binding protein [Orenia metallireducens]|uniref:ATP-binding protein n=1 Tax=Orenia metallireducens TaxID=1413210 RepID=UPI00159F32E4|nr:ATP-binding protein [Orenia metallireducens]
MTSLKVPATMKNLDLMINYVLDKVKGFDLYDSTLLYKLRIVCEEALVNIINYAYQDFDKVGDIEIICNIYSQDKKIILKFIDEGIAFNILEYQDPDLTLPLSERKAGGLGIYIIKSIVDKIEYYREDGKNILILTKSIATFIE